MFRQNPQCAEEYAEEKTFADTDKALAVALLFGATYQG